MASHKECSWTKWILKGAIAVITFTTAKLFRQQYIPNQVQIHEKLNWNANKIVTKYYRLHLVFICGIDIENMVYIWTQAVEAYANWC